MKKKVTPIIVIRTLINITALALFVFLAATGKVQLWIILFLGGLLLSLLLGRIYCGWACPMHTLFRPVEWLYGKLGLKRASVPTLLTHPAVRYFLLGIFLLVTALQQTRGVKMPILVFITGIAFVITLFFEEELWHSHLCPFGTLLSLTGRISPFGMHIDKEQCSSCGNCLTVCPANAVAATDSELINGKNVRKEYRIDKKECLVCWDCTRSCPSQSIDYGRISRRISSPD